MEWSRNRDLIILICEGNAEFEIMNILLDNNELKFQKDMLVSNKLVKTRSAIERFRVL